jgi:hypothetical protein
MLRFLFILTVSVFALCLLGAPHAVIAGTILEIDNFDAGAEGWQVYDYNGLPFPQTGGTNVFYPVTRESSGGIGNSGYIWGDDSRWRIDVPESPNSILSFIIYRGWVGGQTLDLRNATVSVYLRGDSLDLNGADVYFWALNKNFPGGKGGRYHYTSQPLQVSEGAWGTELSFVLQNDESLWHNSWQRVPSDPVNLNDLLANADSYGFSFVGFPTGEEVTGTFSMDSLVITTAPEPTTVGMLASGGLALLAAAWWRKRHSHTQRSRHTPCAVRISQSFRLSVVHGEPRYRPTRRAARGVCACHIFRERPRAVAGVPLL